LQWWSIPRRGWIIILAELAVIVTLASWVYSEYLNNTYFQSYLNGLSPILVPIISVGFGITSATVATLLYFTMRNVRQRGGPSEEDLDRKRVPAKKVVKKTPSSIFENRETRDRTVSDRARNRMPIAGVSSLRRRAARDSGNEEDESG